MTAIIEVSDISIHQDGSRRTVTAQVVGLGSPRELRYEVETSETLKTELQSCDCLALSLLYPAMCLGTDLYIDGALSEEFAYELNGDIQNLLASFDSNLKRIEVHANVVDVRGQGTAVGTGFSAGIDSFYTILSSNAEVPKFRRVNTLSIFDVGAMGPVDKPGSVLRKSTDRLRKFSAEVGMEWVVVTSNLDTFYSGQEMSFIRTHTLRNMAAVAVLQDYFTSYLYSAGQKFSDINASKGVIACIDPILLPMVSRLGVDLIPFGSDLSRVEKIEIVARHSIAQSYLDICAAPPHARERLNGVNCSRCWKCSEALLQIEAMGVLEDFRGQFDIDAFKANSFRAKILVGLGANKKNKIAMEVVEYLQNHGESMALARIIAIFLELKIRFMPGS